MYQPPLSFQARSVCISSCMQGTYLHARPGVYQPPLPFHTNTTRHACTEPIYTPGQVCINPHCRSAIQTQLVMHAGNLFTTPGQVCINPHCRSAIQTNCGVHSANLFTTPGQICINLPCRSIQTQLVMHALNLFTHKARSVLTPTAVPPFKHNSSCMQGTYYHARPGVY